MQFDTYRYVVCGVANVYFTEDTSNGSWVSSLFCRNLKLYSLRRHCAEKSHNGLRSKSLLYVSELYFSALDEGAETFGKMHNFGGHLATIWIYTPRGRLITISYSTHYRTAVHLLDIFIYAPNSSNYNIILGALSNNSWSVPSTANFRRAKSFSRSA